jgi:asparagine synthase (glutamine-hydrolysing)
MFRYVAIVWNDVEHAANEAAAMLSGLLRSDPAGWQVAVKQNGLAVFYAGARAGSSETYLLQNDSGVVLGKLFVRSRDGHSTSVMSPLDAQESDRILATGGRHLLDRYWGRYVAFLRNAASQSTWVLRDPTATLPCHTASFCGVSVYFSWMEDAVRLGLDDFSINWKYIAAALCYTRLQLHSSALEGVSQVLGGECVSVSRGQVSRTFHWDPLRIAGSNVFEDPGEAAEALRHCVQDCVHAWASCHGGIVHTLSGGLDSSIVMACLQNAPSQPQVTCLNYHSSGADTDERHFARLAAQHAGCELIERERNPQLSFEPLLHMQRSSVPPVIFLYYLENNRTEAQIATEHGATAVFSGNTGDQLFYQARGTFAAGDYVSRHGVRRPLFNIALDAARMDRVSVWAVLREALAYRRFDRQWSPSNDAGQFRQLLSADAVGAVQRDERFIHPLFRTPGNVPSGKLYHAYSLLFPPEFHTPTQQADDPELVAPLYSQPLIELCLRIPTYLLTLGGWDRSMARRAFQHDVPREIVTRQTKGGMEEHAKEIFLNNIGLVRELLLDGFLLQEGILDRKKLREVLAGSPTRLGSGTVELYDYFAAEAWLRRWRGAQAKSLRKRSPQCATAWQTSPGWSVNQGSERAAEGTHGR